MQLQSCLQWPTESVSAAGSGISWLWPLVDGAPPIGWDEASRYLVLPVLLVVAQFVSSAIITPPPDPEDDSAQRTQVRLRRTDRSKQCITWIHRLGKA